MAIIVLKGADFSANNIGHVELFHGFSGTTLDVFTKFGITADNDNMMQREVDLFIRTLVDADMWGNGKITHLCLPFLAELSSDVTVANAVKDCIRNTTFFTSNSALSNLQLVNHGITPMFNGGTTATVSGISSFQQGKYHVAAYPLTNDTIQILSGTQHCQNVVFFRGPFIGMYNTSTIFANLDVSNSVGYDINYEGKPRMSIIIGTSGIGDGKARAFNAGQLTLSNSNSYTSKYNYMYFGTHNDHYRTENDDPSGQAYWQTSASYGLLSWGGYLTDEEANIYTNAANRLVAAINQYMN